MGSLLLSITMDKMPQINHFIHYNGQNIELLEIVHYNGRELR